tara:strand:+ start:2810 stop:4507 length:1698 start_codon:yes stop_codon:yes gene_type:complete
MVALAAMLLSGRFSVSRSFACFIVAVICFGAISFDDAIQAITTPSIVAVTSLVVVAATLTKIPGIGRALFGKDAVSPRLSLGRFLGLTALISAVTPNTAVVGAFLGPASRHRSIPAHTLLLPLSYMALAGGMLTPFGTSASLMVVGEAAHSGLVLTALDFIIPGLMVSGAVLLALLAAAPLILKPSKATEESASAIFYFEARVEPGSVMIGRNITDNRLRSLKSFFLAEIIRGEQLITPVNPSVHIQPDDRLIFVGDIEQVDELLAIKGVTLDSSPRSESLGSLYHAVIANNSVLAGRTLREADFRSRFDASVVAISRGEERLSGKLGEIRLQTGDFLILAAGPDFTSRENLRANLHILDVEEPGQVPLSRRNSIALGLSFAAMLIAAIFQIIPFALGAFVMAATCILAGWLSPREAKRIFPIDLIIMLWGAVLLSELVQSSGASDFLAGIIAGSVGGLPPWAALTAIFALAWVMTEMFSNASAALTTLPVALATAAQLALPAEAFVLATAFGASASFLLPFGYQTHLMVMTPGRYRLSHFLRLGGIVFIAYAAAALCSISILHL